MTASGVGDGEHFRFAAPIGIANANPDLTLRDIAAQLEAMYERTPRGSATWTASSVKHLLDRAKKLGLVLDR
ncbi:DNA invertase [Phyllobacterium sp. K27]